MKLLLFSIATCLPFYAICQLFPVTVTFNGFSGSYYMDAPSATTTAFRPVDTFQLAAGVHTFGIGAYGSSNVSFTVNADGSVSGITNGTAASLNGTHGISLNTARLTIDPSHAVYSFSADFVPYPKYQPAKRRMFTLVKGFTYFIASNYSGDYIVNGTPGTHNYPIPENFFFYVDAAGNVSPYNNDPISRLAASYAGSTVTLNTVTENWGPANFNTSNIFIPGYGNITAPMQLYFIKGLGVTIQYPSPGVPFAYYYFIPI